MPFPWCLLDQEHAMTYSATMLRWYVAFYDSTYAAPYRGKLCEEVGIPKGHLFESLDEAREAKDALNVISIRQFAIFGRFI